jgi:hypothetical protein
MYFNILNFFDTTKEQTVYLFETHIFFKKLNKIKTDIQNNPYDVNYRFIQLMNILKRDLSQIEQVFISNINDILIDKLFYNFSDNSIKKMLDETFYNDISNIILDYSPYGSKLIFVKLNNHKKFIIIKNIKFLNNLLKNDFITQIYIEDYDLHKGLTISDLKKFKPVYDFETLSFFPTNINDISCKVGVYNLILIDIKYHYYPSFGCRKDKNINFFIHSIEQLELIRIFFKNKKNVLHNFNLYSIKTIEKDFLHKIYLNINQIYNDTFTYEIYNYCMKLLLSNKGIKLISN